MEFLNCPDCGNCDFSEDFTCQNCRTSLLTGEKNISNSTDIISQPPIRQIAVAAETAINQSNRPKTVKNIGGLIVLICLAAVIYSGFYTGKGKSLKTIGSQFSAQNDLNKFAVETDAAGKLTVVTLTQENVKISAENKSPATIKLLFDCVFEGKTLTRTPDEYHVTIISNDTETRDFEFAQFAFQTESEAFTLEKQTGEQWKAGDNSFEYKSFRISRKNLINLANSKNANFQIGEYQGQINFAQQQSIKSYLTATSLDSKIE